MLVASSRSAGGSIRSAGVFMPLRARCGPTTLSPVARKRAARIKPAENWAQDEGDYLNYRSAALGVAARVFSLYGALKVVERRLLSVLAQKCQKKSIKDASQYSSRLPETSLHPRMRFGLHLPCTHIGRSASDCLVSAPIGSIGSVRDAPASYMFFLYPPQAGGSRSPQVRRAYPQRRRPVDATLEAALCSWGDEVRRQPLAIDATPHNKRT